jgi:hypothetical protein
MADTCASCRFWDRYEGSISTKLGDCRFNPPIVSEAVVRWALPGGNCSDPLDEFEHTIYPASIFPVTGQSSWCGRYEHPGSETSPC